MILILLHHTKLGLPGGFVAVDTFFVISGFVITRLMLGQNERDSFSLLDFYVRRARRLLPALALTIMVVVIAAAVIFSPHWPLPTTLTTAKWAAIGAANFGILHAEFNYFTPHVFNPLLHMWSLGVEEQFYVFFGLLVVTCFWWARRVGRDPAPIIAWLSTVVLAISLTICIVASLGPHEPFGANWGFYHPLARAWEFAVGTILAATWRWGLANRVLSWIGLVLVLAPMLLLTTASNHPGWVTIAPVVGTALLIVGATDDDGLIGRGLRSSVMRWIGDRSYAIYLWHWPFIVFAEALGGGRVAVPLAGLASVPVAALTFAYWENPIRHGRVRLPRAAVAPVTVMIATALVIVATSQVAQRVINTGPVKDFGIQVSGFGFKTAECETAVPLTARDLRPCTFPGSAAQRPVVLMGDSNAGQYNLAVFRAGTELGRKVTLATTPGCPLVLLPPDLGIGCDGVSADSLAWLAEQPPSIVIAASANWVGDGLAQVWQESIQRTYAQIEQQGHVVVHVMSLPHFATVQQRWEPTNCTLLAIHRDPAHCGRTAPITSLEAPWRKGLAAEAAAVRASGVRSINLDPAVCPDGVCRTNVANRWIFRDGTHITRRESEALTPYFVTALRDLP